MYSYVTRIFYEDTDVGGIVYYANYLKFFERARSLWLHSLGIQQSQWLAQDIAFVVSRICVDYRGSAKLDDEIAITINDVQVKQASLALQQSVCLIDRETVIAHAQVRIACVRPSIMKPIAIPATIKGALIHACTTVNS